jgi:hypothetical protein
LIIGVLSVVGVIRITRDRGVGVAEAKIIVGGGVVKRGGYIVVSSDHHWFGMKRLLGVKTSPVLARRVGDKGEGVPSMTGEMFAARLPQDAILHPIVLGSEESRGVGDQEDAAFVDVFIEGNIGGYIAVGERKTVRRGHCGGGGGEGDLERRVWGSGAKRVGDYKSVVMAEESREMLQSKADAMEESSPRCVKGDNL